MPWELTQAATTQRAMDLLCPQSGEPDIPGAYKALGAYLETQLSEVPPKPSWLPSNEELNEIEAMDDQLHHEAIPDFIAQIPDHWDGPDNGLGGQPRYPDVVSTQPLACVSEADTVWCNECWDALQEDNIGDQDPNRRVYAKMPWHPNHVCEGCGCKDGNSLLWS